MRTKLLIGSIGAALLALAPLAASAQSAVGGSVAAPACATFARSLFVGASGADVASLQEYLAERGFFGVAATGYFGPITEAAVARWQAAGGVVAQGGYGSGTFGPLSRAYFAKSCASGAAAPSLSASPLAGPAPLAVQFSARAPAGVALGSLIEFGDGATSTLAYAPTCAGCPTLATASHTYAAPGSYTASLMSGTCACPAGGVCNCPMISVLATTSVRVGPVAAATANIQQVNAPGSVTLAPGGIAEVRNESFYFTLESASASAATIELTPVGCWNSFPSDPPPQILCMIAVVPIPPQTLAVGGSYSAADYSITLTSLAGGQATFTLGAAQTY
jgi:peptidoglycan hydrolase-like protein with peptidoglycan-binding domain